MTTAIPPLPYGTAEPRDAPGSWLLRYALPLPHPLDHVWAAVATPAGLSQWLAVPGPWDPHLDAPLAFTWHNADEEGEDADEGPTVDEGRITAWDPGRVAEYTLALHGRARFRLEPDGPSATFLRLTNEVRDLDASARDSRLASWHHHLEQLASALTGHPADRPARSRTRYRELLAEYASRGPA
ncbi:SRPBCC domain-containing protein [Streptomyces sp. CA-294286]|uniref:SRPBCC domain-containing protein n=1 Tax=Streptomyces sp. CA-294286 TaxID=3240070 RepID=UPI003D94F961